MDRVTQLYGRISAMLSYIEPEILALSQQTLDQFIEETSELGVYKHLFDNINRTRPHIRSIEIEAILASATEMGNTPSTIYSMVSTADLQLPFIENEAGERVELTQGNYSTYIRSANRQVRKEAFEAIHRAFLKQRHTLASTLSGQIKAHHFTIRHRNYASCYEQALARYNIPTSVYDTLIKTVSERTSILDRYLRVRKNMLKLEELTYV